jgi:rare lipoprotein A
VQQKLATPAVILGAGLAVAAPAAVASLSSGSLVSRHSVLLGSTMRFRGAIEGAAAGSTIRIERLGRQGRWSPAATATVGRHGAFVASWHTDHIGHFAVRAVPARNSDGAKAASAPPTRDVTVYRPALATWYGPGFYGHRTACGKRLTQTLLGVAHPRLKCGTQVAFYYNGRTITVPVVDRGPFGGAKWDLTAATARALGFTHTDTVGAVALKRR